MLASYRRWTSSSVSRALLVCLHLAHSHVAHVRSVPANRMVWNLVGCQSCRPIGHGCLMRTPRLLVDYPHGIMSSLVVRCKLLISCDARAKLGVGLFA